MFNLDNYNRMDSSSASNTYYGYSMNVTNQDTDNAWVIRKVTSGSVSQTVWANDEKSFYSNWSNRYSYFGNPTQSLNLTYSYSTTVKGNATYRNAIVSWSPVNGVDKYYYTVTDVNGNVINYTGQFWPSVNPRYYTGFLINQYAFQQSFALPGTYSINITAQNSSGSTSSTFTIFLS